ncbi:MAG: Kelch repeat-containing protein [Candidatus Thorarchaeota archaeon]
MRKELTKGALVVALLLIIMPVSIHASSGTWKSVSCLDYDDSWTEMSPIVAPEARVDLPLVYDSGSDVVLVFGGGRGQGLGKMNDTWAYSYEDDTWTDRSPTVAPSVRAGHMLAYDSESDRVILFSGYIRKDDVTGHICYNETWEYDYNSNTWTNLEPETMPTPRCYGAMAYDEQSDRVILFGGILEGTSVAADTWAYDYNSNTWEQMSPASHPSSRFGAAVAYNSEADRMILYGGVSPSVLKDTWAYHYEDDTWTNLNPTEHPVEAPGQMTYDAEDDLCVFFGGSYDFDETSFSSDTWTYNYSSNSWSNFTPSTRPEARCRATLAYDEDSDRIILFGGMGPGRFANKFNDTWAYDYVPQPLESSFPWELVFLVAAGVGIVAVVVVFWKRR